MECSPDGGPEIAAHTSQNAAEKGKIQSLQREEQVERQRRPDGDAHVVGVTQFRLKKRGGDIMLEIDGEGVRIGNRTVKQRTFQLRRGVGISVPALTPILEKLPVTVASVVAG